MAGKQFTCARCGATAEYAPESHFCETCGMRLVVSKTSQIQGPAVLGPDVAIVTDIGKRHSRNEDAGAIARELVDGRPAYAVVVCDGVSSSSSADKLAAGAAAYAGAALLEVLRAGPAGEPECGVADVIRATHQAACAIKLEPEAGKDPPGATIVTAVAWPGRLSVGWLGDSRAYWITESEAIPLTRDDSWAVEQIDLGAVMAEEAAASPMSHAITHCIGPLEDTDASLARTLAPHTRAFCPTTTGTLLVCSDGFWNYAPDADAVAARVRSASANADAESVAKALVQFALDGGGVDNVTVAVVHLPALD
jgi:serine/threonine protein phosphatase PrpC